jgi:hypothetical protein
LHCLLLSLFFLLSSSRSRPFLSQPSIDSSLFCILFFLHLIYTRPTTPLSCVICFH